jgi:membrane protease YdiL (CAAX protease family)
MKDTLFKWVRKRPFWSFIGVAFGFSWAFWLLLPAESPGEVPVQFLVGAFGPALAAIAVSAILDPGRAPARAPARWIAFGATLLLGSAVVWLSREALFAGDYGLTWLLSAALAVVSAAYLVSCRFSRFRGVRELLRSLSEWRHHAAWYAFVLLFVPFCYALSMGAFVLLTGRELPPLPYAGTWQGLPVALLAAFSLRLFFGGANEEPGWRGFALPLLQRRHSPLAASAIVAVVWSLWHLPLHLNGVYSSGWIGLAQVAARMVMSIPFTVLMTWVYNRTRGSLPLAMLLHAANNTTPQFLLPGFIEQFLIMIVAIVVLVRDKMWKKAKGARNDADL